jgi:ribonuclease HI
MPHREFREARLVFKLVRAILTRRLGSPDALNHLVSRLLFLTHQGRVNAKSVQFALNLFREQSRWESKLRGPDTRVSRRVVFEELVLLKRAYLAGLGLKAPFPLRFVCFGGDSEVEMTASFDASIRPGVCALGVALFDERTREPIAELSLPCVAQQSGEAEALAALQALKTMHCLGVRSVRLRTDSDVVFAALVGTDGLHRHTIPAWLRLGLLTFIYRMKRVELVRVPRALNLHSDRLAARILSR